MNVIEILKKYSVSKKEEREFKALNQVYISEYKRLIEEKRRLDPWY